MRLISYCITMKTYIFLSTFHQTESPARKRRKLHGASLQDVTNSASPPPPVYLTRSLAEHHHPTSHLGAEAARPRSRSRSRSSDLLALQQVGAAANGAAGNSGYYGNGNNNSGSGSVYSSNSSHHHHHQQQQQQQLYQQQQHQQVQRKRTLPTRRASGESRTQTPPRPRRRSVSQDIRKGIRKGGRGGGAKIFHSVSRFLLKIVGFFELPLTWCGNHKGLMYKLMNVVLFV